MFKNFLSRHCANTKSRSNPTRIALFIFALMQKRTKKIKKFQCFFAQVRRTPAWTFGPTRSNTGVRKNLNMLLYHI